MIMNIKIFLIALLIFTFSSSFSQETVFEAPNKVVKSCDRMYKLNLNDTTKNGDFKFLYLYFKNAHFDTIIVYDSIFRIDNEGNFTIKDTQKTKYLNLKKGKIYLVNNIGELLYRKPVTNIELPFEYLVKEAELDYFDYMLPIQYYYYSYGYNDYILKRFKNEQTDTNNLILNKFDKNIKNLLFPFIYIERKGKWGIIDFEGNIIEKPQYFEIKYADRGIELYKKEGILEKVIKLKTN